jgi:hypothetical protein
MTANISLFIKWREIDVVFLVTPMTVMFAVDGDMKQWMNLISGSDGNSKDH